MLSGMRHQIRRLLAESPVRCVGRLLLILSAAGALAIVPKAAQTGVDSLPRIDRSGPCARLVVDGKPVILLGAEVENSSSSSLEYMEQVWPRLRQIGAHAAYVPITWESLEPSENRFDFTLVDGLVDRARRERLHLVLLWFGAFKNTFGSYAPTWVRSDRKRFPMAEPVRGQPSGAFSVFSPAVLAADQRAYSTLMRHLRDHDRLHTVVMIQVENEIGLLGALRDHSKVAEDRFGDRIPPSLSNYLNRNRDRLLPELRGPWIASGGRTEGNWKAVFGSVADEVFMAWNYGRYVESVASSGKAQLPIPCYVNAWVEGEPGTYPMGGPVSRMMDIWRAAAPSVDLLAPDLYGDLKTFDRKLANYARSRNPVAVVECSPDQSHRSVFSAVAGHNAMVFGPYPVEAKFDPRLLRETYRQLTGMMPLLIAAQGTGRLRSILVQGDDVEVMNLGSFRLTVRRSQEASPSGNEPGYGLVLEIGDGDFVFMGKNFQVSVDRPDGLRFERDYVDEGTFVDGRWVAGRRLNGDEYEGALTFGPKEPGYRDIEVPVHIRRAKFVKARA